jgi:hypothetical protein
VTTWTLMTFQLRPDVPGGNGYHPIGTVKLAIFPLAGQKITFDGVDYVVSRVNGPISAYAPELRVEPWTNAPLCERDTVVDVGPGDDDAALAPCGVPATGFVTSRVRGSARPAVPVDKTRVEWRCGEHIGGDTLDQVSMVGRPEAHPQTYAHYRDIALSQAEYIGQQAKRIHAYVAEANRAKANEDLAWTVAADYARKAGVDDPRVAAQDLHEERLLTQLDRRNHFLEGVHWELLALERELRERPSSVRDDGLSAEQTATLSATLSKLLDYRRRDREAGKPGPRERSGSTALFGPVPEA